MPVTELDYNLIHRFNAGDALRRTGSLRLAADAAECDDLRREYDALSAEYFEDNVIRQDYLITRATKI